MEWIFIGFPSHINSTVIAKTAPDKSCEVRIGVSNVNEAFSGKALTRRGSPTEAFSVIEPTGSSMVPSSANKARIPRMFLYTINNWGDFYKEENERKSHAEQQVEKA